MLKSDKNRKKLLTPLVTCPSVYPFIKHLGFQFTDIILTVQFKKKAGNGGKKRKVPLTTLST